MTVLEEQDLLLINHITCRESEEHEDGIVRKREKASHELADQLNRMYETMVNYRTQDGLELCDAFIQLPNRRELPEYYEVRKMKVQIAERFIDYL